MITLIPRVLCLVFFLLALLHFRLALNPRFGANFGKGGSVPSVGGKPLFTPTRKATVAVGVVLLLFATLVAATSGLLPLGLPPMLLSSLSYGLALGLLLRALGEFRYLGFFKRVRGSKFATLDTFVYSPLCLLLAAGVAFVARQAE